MLKVLSPPLLFFLSVIVEILSLALLRYLGIDWDYHVDAVTYVEKSKIISESIFLSKNLFLFLNNGYYIFVDFLGSNPSYIISFNIIFFSLTNVLIALIMRPFRHKNYVYFEYLILFNPYRIYLGTTLLKDTLICFLLIFAYFFYNLKNYKYVHLEKYNYKKLYLILHKFLIDKIIVLICFILLLCLGYRSIFYLFLFPRFLDNPKSFKSLAILGCLVLAINFLLSSIWGGSIAGAFENASIVNMDFREYGAIPNFSSLGSFGILLKTVFWPLFYISGIFIIFSPTLELLFISIGITFVFILQLKDKLSIPVGALIGYMFFSGITNGFLSFARYSLPLWLLSVIIAYCNNSRKLTNEI